jgi:hypothetical protein
MAGREPGARERAVFVSGALYGSSGRRRATMIRRMNAAAHRIGPPTAADTRRHGRLRSANVTCRFAGQVHDISASGLRLKLDRPAPVDVNSELTLVLGAGGRSLEVKTRVIWSRAEEFVHDLGLEFVGNEPEVRSALFDLVWNGPDAEGPVASLALNIAQG